VWPTVATPLLIPTIMFPKIRATLTPMDTVKKTLIMKTKTTLQQPTTKTTLTVILTLMLLNLNTTKTKIRVITIMHMHTEKEPTTKTTKRAITISKVTKMQHIHTTTLRKIPKVLTTM